MVELRVLGEFSVWRDGRLLALGAKKYYGLLAVLALEQGRVLRRDRLTSLLWERADRTSARQSLRQAIYALRSRLPNLPLEANRDEVWLPEGEIAVDALRFKATALAERWEEAAGLYRGRFLSGFWISDSPAFQDWQESLQQSLESLAYHAIQEALKRAESRGEWPKVEDFADRLLAIDSLDEAAYRAKLRAIAASGETRRARLLFERVDAFLREELGRPPERETLELFEEIQAVEAGRPGPSDAEEEHDALTTFQGREEEFRSLREAWISTRSGEARTVLVLGEAGIGKTRFCRHFLRYAAIQGSRILQGKCFSSEMRVPYSGLAEALVAGLHPEDIRELPPAWSEVVLELLPELGSANEAAAAGPRPASDGSSRRLFEGVARLLQVSSTKRDVVLLLDDFQWADASTVALVHYLNRRLGSSRVLLLLSLRPEDTPADSAVRLLVGPPSPIGRFRTIRLGVLPDKICDAIVESFLVRENVAIPPTLRDAVVKRAGGHPFFLLETLKAIRDGEVGALRAQGPMDHASSLVGLPASVGEFLSARFGSLSVHGLEVMRALSVVGREARLELLRAITGQPVAAFVQGVEELISKGLVQESSNAVRFVHDLVREAAYEHMTGFRRRSTHARAAAAMQHLDYRRPGQIAWHYDLAGNRAAAYRFALLAAQESERVYAHAETEYFIKLALTNASSTEERFVCESRLATLLYRLRRFDDAEVFFAKLEEHNIEVIGRDSLLPIQLNKLLMRAKRGGVAAAELVVQLESLAAAAEATGSQEQTALVLRSLAEAAHDAGRRDIIASVVPKLLALGRAADTGPTGPGALAMAATMAGLYESVSVGIRYANEALTRAERVGLTGGTIMALLARAGNLIQAARLSEAAVDLDLALDTAEQRALVEFRYSILNNQGALYGELGSFREAEAALAEAARFVTEYDGAHDLLFLYANLSLVKVDMGELDEAAKAAERVLAYNATVGAWWAGVNAYAVLGLRALERGQLAEANRCRREILALFEGRDFWVGDFSYAEMFLARLAAVEGEEERGLVRLDRAVAAYEGRDVMCWSRLQLERARLLLGLDRTEARRTARQVRSRAAVAGARPLVAKAEAILDRLLVKE